MESPRWGRGVERMPRQATRSTLGQKGGRGGKGVAERRGADRSPSWEKGAQGSRSPPFAAWGKL